MYRSKYTDYNIVDATPYKRDSIADLAAACQRHGIKLCFYYSQTQDWRHPGGHANDWDFDPASKDFAGYVRDLYRLATDAGSKNVDAKKWKAITQAPIMTNEERSAAHAQFVMMSMKLQAQMQPGPMGQPPQPPPPQIQQQLQQAQAKLKEPTIEELLQHP